MVFNIVEELSKSSSSLITIAFDENYSLGNLAIKLLKIIFEVYVISAFVPSYIVFKCCNFFLRAFEVSENF